MCLESELLLSLIFKFVGYCSSLAGKLCLAASFFSFFSFLPIFSIITYSTSILHQGFQIHFRSLLSFTSTGIKSPQSPILNKKSKQRKFQKVLLECELSLTEVFQISQKEPTFRSTNTTFMRIVFRVSLSLLQYNYCVQNNYQSNFTRVGGVQKIAALAYHTRSDLQSMKRSEKHTAKKWYSSVHFRFKVAQERRSPLNTRYIIVRFNEAGYRLAR